MKLRKILVFEIAIVLSLGGNSDQAYLRTGESGNNASTTNILLNEQNHAEKGNELTGNATNEELDLVANGIIQTFQTELELQENETKATNASNDATAPAKRKQLRVLTPVDLTQQFTFDDEEEMAIANYSEADMENMKLEIENIFRSNDNDQSDWVNPTTMASMSEDATERQVVTVSTSTTTTTEAPSFFQSVKTKVDKGVSFFGGLVKKPFQVLENVIRPTTTATPTPPASTARTPPRPKIRYEPVNSLRIPASDGGNRIIFPDDDDNETDSVVATNQNKRGTNTSGIDFAPPGSGPTLQTAQTEIPSPDCEPHEIVHNSKCETLFSRSACENGSVLLENESTGEVGCEPLPCPDFPQYVSHGGKCVMQSYFTGCPAGMHLIMERSGEGFCDCKPGHIYSSASDKCFEAFTRGPCQASEYFILGTNLQPQCERNPCQRSGYVCYGPNCPHVVAGKGRCVRLQSFCENGDGIFLVSSKTLKPECLSMTSLQDSLEERLLGNVGQFSCSPGTKRDLTGRCRKSIKFSFS